MNILKNALYIIYKIPIMGKNSCSKGRASGSHLKANKEGRQDDKQKNKANQKDKKTKQKENDEKQRMKRLQGSKHYTLSKNK